MADWDPVRTEPIAAPPKAAADPWAPVATVPVTQNFSDVSGGWSQRQSDEPDYSSAFKDDVGLGESIVRGLAQGGERFSGFANLIAGMPIAKLIDTVTGNDSAQDTVGQWVTENYRRAQDYGVNPNTEDQGLGSSVAQGLSSMLPDIAATLATGGEYAGANAAIRPTIQQSVGRMVAADLEQAAATGVRSSAIPSAERATELGKDVTQAGGTLPEALGAAATGGLSSALTNALPASASGNVLTRALQGAVSNPVADLAQTQLENAAIPDRLGIDQQMDMRDLLVSSLTGAPLGAGLGERGHDRINNPAAMRPLGEALTPDEAWTPVAEVKAPEASPPVAAEPARVARAPEVVEVLPEPKVAAEPVTQEQLVEAWRAAPSPEAKAQAAERLADFVARGPEPTGEKAPAEVAPAPEAATEATPEPVVAVRADVAEPVAVAEAIPGEFTAKTKGGEFRLLDEKAPEGSDFSEFGEVRQVQAFDGDKPIGKLIYANDGTPPTVEVDEAYRRKGVATAMLKLAKQSGGVVGDAATGVRGKAAEYRTDAGQAFRSAADESTVELSPRAAAPARVETVTPPAEAAVSRAVEATPVASTEQADPEKKSTGTKNAVVALERSRAGKDPIIKEAAVSNAETLGTAVKALKDNPRLGDEIVAKLRSQGPSSVSAVDEAALLVHKTQLRNERDDAAKVLGDPDAKPEAREAAQRAWDEAEAKINEVDQAAYASGREWGRLGQFRQRMLRADFTLEAMERRVRAVSGKPLTEAESSKIAELSKRINELEDQAAKANERVSDADSIQTYDELLKVMQKEFRSTPKKRPTLDVLKAAAEASRVALGELQGVKSKNVKQTGAVMSPVALYHLARIGAYHIANGAVKLADWTARMRTDLGEKFDEYRAKLPQVFQASKLLVDRPVGEGATVEQVLGEISDKPEGGDIRALAEAHIRAGLRGEAPVIQAVTASLKGKLGEAAPTEREVRRLFADYGKVTFPSQDAVKVELRQLRSLVQMQESIDRLSEGLAALKSGPQRDRATQAVREKRQQLNDLLKRATSNAKTPEQLASYQDARVRNLKNQIEDIGKQIETGERPEKKAAPAPSAEVVRLTQQRDELRRKLDQEGAGERKNEAEKAALRKQIKAIDEALTGKPRPESAVESRVDDLETTQLRGRIANLRKQLAGMRKEDAQTKQIQGRISELLQRLAGKEKEAPQARAADSPAVANLKRIRDDLSAQLRELQGGTKADPEQRYQEMRGKTFQRRINELQQRIASGDFEKRVRVPRELTKANLDAQFELNKVKEEFERLRFEAELEKRTPLQKVLGGTRDAINLARAIMTSVDFSGLLRQGGFISYGHPLRAAKASPAALKAFVSEKAEFAANKQIEERPNYRLYKKFGLELTGIGSGPLSKVEEAYATRWLNRVPKLLGGGVVRGSGRSYTVLLNRLRADSFDAMVAALSRNGSKPTDEEGKAIANYINVATGRGKIGGSNNAGEVLNTVFFAPRLVASRFQLLAGQPLYGGTVRTRNLIAQEYARFLIGVSLAIALAAQMKDEDDDTPVITLDPRSADFGKVRFGKTYLDPLAGLAQVTTFLGRTISGENRNMKGELVPLRNEYRITDYLPELGDGSELKKVKYGGTTNFDVVANFIRSKLAPVPGAVVNTVEGTNMIGEPVSPGETAVSLVTPMTFGNIADIMEEQGVPRGTAVTVLGLLGMGIQYRKSKEERAAEAAKREAEKNGG